MVGKCCLKNRIGLEVNGKILSEAQALINGEPWFVAKDVCAILELGNVAQACVSLDEDEVSSIEANIINNDIARGGRNPLIISESGLYALIFKSRKPDEDEGGLFCPDPLRRSGNALPLRARMKTKRGSILWTPLAVEVRLA